MSAAVTARMERVRREAWANPSSVHREGRAAARELERARAELAEAVGVSTDRVVFTSGGTEAANLGVLGLAEDARGVVTNGVEHPAVGAAVAALSDAGVPCRRLGARLDRWPTDAAWDEALPEPGWLVAWQWVNHETGTVQPIERVLAACRRRGARLFVDAVQGLGKLPWPREVLGAASFSVAGTKVGGPAGSGALVLAPGVEPTSRTLGGMQERGRRAGTPDVVAAAGLAEAAMGAAARLADMPRIAALRDRIERRLVSLGAVVNGAEGARVATVSDVSIRGWRGDTLVAALDLAGLAASAGAACSSGVDQGSTVIAGLYPEDAWRARHALRLSLGCSTTVEEVERAEQILDHVLRRAPTGA